MSQQTIASVCHLDIESLVRLLLTISHEENVMLAHTHFNGTRLNDISEWTMQYEQEEQTSELTKSIGETQ